MNSSSIRLPGKQLRGDLPVLIFPSTLHSVSCIQGSEGHKANQAAPQELGQIGGKTVDFIALCYSPK